MKVLTKGEDNKYTLADGETFSAIVGSVTGPFTGNPVSGSQALTFGAVTLVGGIVIGRMFGSNIPLINNLNSN